MLDDNGERIGNPIKSSLIGEWARLHNIEKRCADNREYLKELDRRKALAGRIRRVVAECAQRGYTSQAEIERRLSESGISAVFRYNDDGRLTGATFIDHRGKNVYNGSNLGKDLSANSWHALFSEVRQPTSRQERLSSELTAEPAATSAQQRSSDTTTSTTDDSSTDTPDTPSEPTGEYDDNEYEQVTTPQRERYPANEHEADYHIGHDIFCGLFRQGDIYEEIDPEFRTLYKRKKKTVKRRR